MTTEKLSYSWDNPEVLNKKPRKYIKYPCITVLSDPYKNIETGEERNKTVSDRLYEYPGLMNQYKGDLMETLDDNDLSRYMASAEFFNYDPEKDERKEYKNVRKLEMNNPDKYVSLENEKEKEKQVTRTNALHSKWFIDPGMAQLQYDIAGDDYVNIVRESNEAYKKYRDKFVVAPTPGPDKNIAELLKQMREEDGKNRYADKNNQGKTIPKEFSP